MDSRLEHAIAVVFGLPFVVIGIQHFLDPAWFEPIVPKILGNPTFWVIVSGIPEVGLGIAVIIPMTRKWAALGLAALLVILYWANLNMWINDIPYNGTRLTTQGHLVRLSIQILLIAGALGFSGLGKLKGSN